MSDYGDQCRDLKEAKRRVRAKHGVPCPECVKKLPRANPTLLLPQQTCKIHKYRDPRPRDYNKTMWGEAGYTMQHPDGTVEEPSGKAS